MHEALPIDPRKYTSRMQCEPACPFEHTGAFNPARSRTGIKAERRHGSSGSGSVESSMENET